jgi:hypothetical protein
MTMKRRHLKVRALVVLVEALLISWALLYLSEYFGWRWTSELGGAV